MSARRQWIAATGCALVVSAGAHAGPPSAHAKDAALYLSGTRNHPVPAGQIDLTKVNSSLTNYGMAQQIGYLASLFPVQGQAALDPSVAIGVAATEAAIALIPDSVRIVIVDVSQGGIVASQVERDQLAAGSTRTFLFIRLGDPTGPNGIMGRNPGIKLPGLSFVTAPNDSPWDRIIIAHQYEGLSDWPADQLNLLADINAVLGAIRYHNPWSYAVDLSTLPGSAVTVSVNAAGGTTTTYRIPATGLLPILVPLKAAGVDDRTLATWQKVLKPIIDSAYTPQTTSPAGALGRRLFVTAVNGMTAGANQAGVTIRQTQRYLDTAIAHWRASARLLAPESTPSVPEAEPISPSVSAPPTPRASTLSTADAPGTPQRSSMKARGHDSVPQPSRHASVSSRGLRQRLAALRTAVGIPRHTTSRIPARRPPQDNPGHSPLATRPPVSTPTTTTSPASTRSSQSGESGAAADAKLSAGRQ